MGITHVARRLRRRAEPDARAAARRGRRAAAPVALPAFELPRAARPLRLGEVNADSAAYAWQRRRRGRRWAVGMFSGGAGPWAGRPERRRLVGRRPAVPRSGLRAHRHPRETVVKQGGSSSRSSPTASNRALEQARAEPADELPCSSPGGASVVQQYLSGGLPTTCGSTSFPCSSADGVRLFGDRGPELELLELIDSPSATHLRYRVLDAATASRSARRDACSAG